MEGMWNKEGRNRFKQKLGGVELRERGIEKEWGEMEGKLKEVMLCELDRFGNALIVILM